MYGCEALILRDLCHGGARIHARIIDAVQTTDLFAEIIFGVIHNFKICSIDYTIWVKQNQTTKKLVLPQSMISY